MATGVLDAKKWAAATKKLGKAWKAVRTNTGGGGGNADIEDGTYIAKISKAAAGQKDAKSPPYVMITYVITKGEYKGVQLRSFDRLETEQNLDYLRRRLQAIGIDTEDLELIEMIECLEEIQKKKPAVKITVKNNGDYQNIYVDGRAKAKADDDDEDEDEDDDDSDSDDDESDDDDDESDDDESDDDDDDDDESDDDDEEPAPKKRGRKPVKKKTVKKKKPAKKSRGRGR